MQTVEAKFQNHTGFVLYDPLQKKTLYDYKGSHYFTPGSNTKIFTFFASLKLLGDSVPGIRYATSGDSLIFWGTGDPSLLYTKTHTNNKVMDFLGKEASTYRLFYSPANFNTEYFGRGWAWDDYNDYYSTERSSLPLYGNIVTVSNGSKRLNIDPPFLRKSVFMGEKRAKPEVRREEGSNLITYHPGNYTTKKVFEIPVKVTPELTRDLLADTLKQNVQLVNIPVRKDTRYVNSIPTDSLYKVMMKESDNFVAEQLLLLCSNAVSDTLDPDIAIKYVTKEFLTGLTDKPIWIDGSGLSRYNLFTPRTIAQLWEKIYSEVPRERLFSLLATGGTVGTLKNYFKSEQPYVFGKTGTLSNNHCLSGFLVTKHGRILIFSFMNSNFVRPVSEIRIEMEHILKDFYEKL
ncbi:MAG TPA: D-alanyl-D-alanine carboxypeptidase [Ohtaekwangia sp.]